MNNISIKTGNLFNKDFSKRTIYRQEIANMFKIVRFPKKLESFFDSLEKAFHWDHFDYFRMLVLLIVFSWGRRNISTLYRHLDNRCQTHRSRFNNFLNLSRWNCQVILQMKAYELLGNPGLRRGDVVEFLLDDSNM